MPHFHVPADYFLLTSDSVDMGLGAIVNKEEENGKFRVPTLRNIALMHRQSSRTVFIRTTRISCGII